MKYLEHQLCKLSTRLVRTLTSFLSVNSQLIMGLSQHSAAKPGAKNQSGYALFRGKLVALFMLLLICLVQLFPIAYARHNSDHPLTSEEWQEVMEKVSLLDNAVLIPSLLPVILSNRDALELNNEQLERLYHWRKEHYADMVNIMNEVIEKRVQFRIESLSAAVTGAHLAAFQEEIQQLERELLKIRLTCRAIVMETFTPEQWETFEFLVADDPMLGSLISQRSIVNLSDK